MRAAWGRERPNRSGSRLGNEAGSPGRGGPRIRKEGTSGPRLDVRPQASGFPPPVGPHTQHDAIVAIEDSCDSVGDSIFSVGQDCPLDLKQLQRVRRHPMHKEGTPGKSLSEVVAKERFWV